MPIQRDEIEEALSAMRAVLYRLADQKTVVPGEKEEFLQEFQARGWRSIDERIEQHVADQTKFLLQHPLLADQTRWLPSLQDRIDTNWLDSCDVFVALSNIQDLAEVPLRRYMGVSFYASDIRSDHTATAAKDAVDLLAAALGFDVVADPQAQGGSWFKRWVLRSREAMTSPEVQKRIRKLERAIDLVALERSQADVNKVLVESAALLLGALTSSPNGAFLLGTLLLVKVTRNGEEQVFARNLSQEDLAKVPGLTHDPVRLIKTLQFGPADELAQTTGGGAQ